MPRKSPQEAWKAALKKKGQLASGQAGMALRERPEDAAALAAELVEALHRWISEAQRDGMGAGAETLHEHFDQRLSIVPAVAAAGQAALPLLMADVRASDAATRAGAAAVLAQMGPAAHAAIADLEKVVATTDPRDIDHGYAVEALAEHRGYGGDLVPGLAAILDSGVTRTEPKHGREFDATALWRSQRLLNTRWIALRAIARAGAMARPHSSSLLPGTIAALGHGSLGEQALDSRIRRVSALLALEALGVTSPPVQDALATAAASRDDAAWMAPRVAAALGVALRVAPADERSEADIDELIGLARGDGDRADQEGWEDRVGAAAQLATLGPRARRALPALRVAVATAERYEGPDWCAPLPALIEPLIALSDPADALTAIYKYLDSNDDDVIAAAVRAARHLGSHGAPLVPRLHEILADALEAPHEGNAEELAQVAAEALGGIGPVARVAWDALVALRAAPFDAASQALAALVRIDASASADILGAVVRGEDAESDARCLAARELASLGAEAAGQLDALAAGIRGAEHAEDRREDVAQECLLAVARLGSVASPLHDVVATVARHDSPERVPATRWLAEIAAREIGGRPA